LISSNKILGGVPGFGGGVVRPDGGRRSNRSPQRGANVRLELSDPVRESVLGGQGRNSIRPGTRARGEKLSVTIPAGVDDVQKIRLRLNRAVAAGGTPAI